MTSDDISGSKHSPFPVTAWTQINSAKGDDEAARRACEDYQACGLYVRRIKPPEPHKDWAALNAAMPPKEERD